MRENILMAINPAERSEFRAPVIIDYTGRIANLHCFEILNMEWFCNPYQGAQNFNLLRWHRIPFSVSFSSQVAKSISEAWYAPKDGSAIELLDDCLEFKD